MVRYKDRLSGDNSWIGRLDMRRAGNHCIILDETNCGSKRDRRLRLEQGKGSNERGCIRVDRTAFRIGNRVSIVDIVLNEIS